MAHPPRFLPEDMAQKALKLRLDQLMVERGLATSRVRAQALILAGKVYSGEQRLDKAGISLAIDHPLALRGQDHPWVSRGGVKLAAALERFAIDPAGRTAIDIGASTGGFTDVLLAHGAAKVFAVDVGHGQLAWSIRQDPRVVVLERTNARYLSDTLIPDRIELVVCDASFIGLRTILPASLELLQPGGRLVALIKPQFEVGKGQIGKGGVVREERLHQAVCAEIRLWLEHECGWQVEGIADSPILGPKGNREFLIAALKPL